MKKLGQFIRVNIVDLTYLLGVIVMLVTLGFLFTRISWGIESRVAQFTPQHHQPTNN